MAIKNAKLGGVDLGEEAGKPSDWNDTFDEVVNTRINGDGFMYDVGNISHTGDTVDTKKKTITFNKAVDYVIVHFRGVYTTSAARGWVSFKKNGTLQTPLGVPYMTANSSSTEFWVQSNRIEMVGIGTSGFGVYVLIDASFAVNDDLEIFLQTTDNTRTVEANDVIVFGYTNKSSDTTWVSVS